jgi:hypothetical protein
MHNNKSADESCLLVVTRRDFCERWKMNGWRLC